MRDARPQRLPLLDRLAARPPDGRVRSTTPASTSTPGSSTSCSPPASGRGSRCTTGTSPRRWRTPAGGRRATPPTRFAEYATAVVEPPRRPGHRWTTLNEPWCSAFLGYATGAARAGPPRRGGVDPRRPPPVARARPGGGADARRPARPRVRHHAQPLPRRPGVRPRRGRRRGPPSTARATACSSIPSSGAAYPDDVRVVRADLRPGARSTTATLAVIAAPLDVLGINYYSRHTVEAADPGRGGPRQLPREPAGSACTTWPRDTGRPSRHGLGDRPDGSSVLCECRYDFRAATVRHRERCRLPRRGPRRRRGRRRPTASPSSTGTSARASRRSTRASTCAATSPGRCSTTSNGPTGTARSSGWWPSTWKPSTARRSKARCGTPRSARTGEIQQAG